VVRREALSLLLLDVLLVLVAWWLAFWLRFNLDVPPEVVDLALHSGLWVLLSYVLGLSMARVYRQVWRYIGLPELRQLGLGVLISGVLSAAVVLMLRYPNFPRSVLLLQPLLALVLLGAVRASWRSLVERTASVPGAKPLLIVGTLQDAADALRALKGSQQWHPVGIVSPLAVEVGLSLQRVPVLGALESIATIAYAVGAGTALVASPPGSPERRALLLQSEVNAGGSLTLLTLPRPDQWLHAQTAGPRKIELEDLLGREAVQLDVKGLSDLFAGQTVLVTGAGGSIGSELCRQIARLGARQLVCLDVSEFAIYQLAQELQENHPQLDCLYYTANVREADRILAITQTHKPAVVFHAAAYKHVPLMEALNEIEAVRTNILGTLNVARAAGACGAQRFVLISTDKAVNPTNVMGATKRMAELVVQSVAQEFAVQYQADAQTFTQTFTQAHPLRTQFVSVRFGNVLGSSGSVVPLFTAQIARGGPVTVTHPDIVRYFMTIPEAAQLVLQAGLMGQSGQIFVLDMGEPVKIVDLARLLIRLSGKTEHQVSIRFSGLRPGEKLFEELLADDETTLPTPHLKLRVAKVSGQSGLSLQAVVDWVNACGPSPASALLRPWLQTYVPEYQPASR